VPTAARAAKNERLFREVNERILELQEDFGRTYETADFICECSHLACTEHIRLTLAEYGSVRAEPAQFVVTPGHVDLNYERVIRATERYAVVEKFGVAGRMAADDSERGSTSEAGSA
jgi:hypothetical protein